MTKKTSNINATTTMQSGVEWPKIPHVHKNRKFVSKIVVSLAIDQLNCNEFVQIARNSDKWRQSTTPKKTERRKQKINLPLIFFDAYPHVVIYFLLNFSTIGGT
jgi:pyruvate formate-lyase activating enzyme-like uncharacterized protein